MPANELEFRNGTDFHTSLNDQKDAGAWLSFPEKHSVWIESPLHCAVRQHLNLGFAQGRRECNFRKSGGFRLQAFIVIRHLSPPRRCASGRMMKE